MKLSDGKCKKTIKSENMTITQMSSYTAHKTISQKYSPNSDLRELMETFTKMVNHCLKIGIKEDGLGIVEVIQVKRRAVFLLNGR